MDAYGEDSSLIDVYARSAGAEGGEEFIYESPMRAATEENKKMRRKSRKLRILARRGAFHWLPVHFSNDLVHGSWWFVAGSVMATLIPIIPLVDLFYPYWGDVESSLPLLGDEATFILLIVSGAFFTLGSLAFVRATEDPPLKPLFSHDHLVTDELLAAWLFLLATIPFVPFMAVYVYYNVDVFFYWGALLGSIIFVIATYMFVLACYPTDVERDQFAPKLVAFLCGEDCWMHKHLCNDWLAALWVFFYGSVLLTVGSFGMLVYTLRAEPKNQLEVFEWIFSTIDSLLFLVGCAYFCAGSYPQVEHHHSHETEKKMFRDPSSTSITDQASTNSPLSTPNIGRKLDEYFDEYNDDENMLLENDFSRKDHHV